MAASRQLMPDLSGRARFPVHPLAMAVPALSVLPFAILAAMPWSAPDAIAFGLPLIALSAIHFWAVRHATYLPAVAVFSIGLFVDLVTGGPLGYWALLYLAGYAFGAYVPIEAEAARQRAERGRTMLSFLAMVLATSVAAWAVACIFFVRVFDPWPFAGGALLSIGVWPLVVHLLEPLAGLFKTDTDHHLSYRTESSQ
jgi:rod shape-determining protein MreD